MKNPDRFSDGFQVIIGGKVVFDSEADAYGVPSKVGQRYRKDEKPMARKPDPEQVCDDEGVMEGRRYTVEATDEYGSFDYDLFEDAKDAIDCAAGLNAAQCAKVIDRQEQAVIWSVDAVEGDR